MSDSPVLDRLVYDPDRSCPKCGNEVVSTQYQADSHGYGCADHRPSERGCCDDEHFDRWCARCRYQWSEALQPTNSTVVFIDDLAAVLLLHGVQNLAVNAWPSRALSWDRLRRALGDASPPPESP